MRTLNNTEWGGGGRGLYTHNHITLSVLLALAVGRPGARVFIRCETSLGRASDKYLSIYDVVWDHITRVNYRFWLQFQQYTHFITSETFLLQLARNISPTIKQCISFLGEN